MSRWSEVIKFVKVEQTTDDDGFPVTTETVGDNVFANKKSVRSAEFYQAAQQGFELQVMFEVRSIDYNDERILLWCEKKYEIVRTYEKTDIIELVCRIFDGVRA
ncbi:phage head closure protein [Domibacillus aminovorans]|uniref:Phage head-tail adapter protein n=1 Tax=Domibacillus aminovorans TaxID=29332 RepID=A0A177L4Z6_9BACI|nr:phage head closure protein [Domibacillus aminovorans]OAH60750.1 hypothetical protein AWH49_15535 [Domibacillus aminovorans]